MKKCIKLCAMSLMALLLTALWMRGWLPYPVIPRELSLWLLSVTDLGKEDLTIMVGFIFFLSTLYLISYFILKRFK